MPQLRRMLPFALSLVMVLVVALPTLTVVVPSAPSAHALGNDTIVIGVTDLPTTLDPGEAYDFTAWEVLSHLYVGLVRQTPGAFSPEALASYAPANDEHFIGIYGYEYALATGHTVSDDRLTYTFTLREDVAFSDGTPITAETFVDSINRVQQKLYQQNETNATQAVDPFVANIRATADGKLVFELTHPVPYFLALLALPPYFPVHPDLANLREPRSFPKNDTELIGNGPYVLKDFEVGDHITLEANPTYNLGPQPATTTIRLQKYPRSQDIRDALAAGEIDMGWRAVFLNHLVQLETLESLNVVEIPSTRVFYLYMNHRQRESTADSANDPFAGDEVSRDPFSEPEVREAVTLLLNRQSVVDNIFRDHATPLTSLLPTLFPDAYAPIWPDEPDLDTAEAILLRANYSDSANRKRLIFGIEVSQPTYGDLYVFAANELYRASFALLNIIAQRYVPPDSETSALTKSLEEGTGEVILFGWTPIVPHPDAYLRPLTYSTSLIPAKGEYAKPEVIDPLLDDAAQLEDPAAQGERYRAVAERLLDDYDIAPLWQEHIYVIAQDDIGGIVLEPNFFLHYDLLTRK